MERQRKVTGRKYLDRRTGAVHEEGANGKNQGGVYDIGKNIAFVNPYSYMSAIDARIAEYLLELGVAFAYQYFDQVTGPATPMVKQLLPNYAPPFTLPDYHVVIQIQSDFWGSIPQALNTDALAQVLLTRSGWHCVTWTEAEITGFPGVAVLMQRDLPEVVHGVFKGQEIPSPYGTPNTWNRRRQIQRGVALVHSKHKGPRKIEGAAEADDTERTRSKRLTGTIVDNTRRRKVSKNTGQTPEGTSRGDTGSGIGRNGSQDYRKH